MKVALNARLLAAPTLRGWNRYTINLLAQLPALNVRTYLYTDRPIHPDHLARLKPGSFEVRQSPPMRYPLWEQRWQAQQCRDDKIDVLHCPFNFGLPWFAPCSMVLTLHDAIIRAHIQSGTRWRDWLSPGGAWASISPWVARTRADRIITVSHHAKADITTHFRINADKISVIYEAADDRFALPKSAADAEQVRERHQLRNPFVLYVGGLESRKNIAFLLKGFALADLNGIELVLAGGQDEERERFRAMAASLGIARSVRFLGWVSDTELPVLYSQALCFVYPSKYEGFGLQLCEAMAAGCPVLAANATSLPEVLGDGGLAFDICDPARLAALLCAVAHDECLRQDLIARGLRRSRAFSWSVMARQTQQLYHSVLLEFANRPVHARSQEGPRRAH